MRVNDQGLAISAMKDFTFFEFRPERRYGDRFYIHLSVIQRPGIRKDIDRNGPPGCQKIKSYGTYCDQDKYTYKEVPGFVHHRPIVSPGGVGRSITDLAWDPSASVILTAYKNCGDGWRNFELASRLSFTKLDRSIQKLRRIYREKPEWFEILDFAQKIY